MALYRLVPVPSPNWPELFKPTVHTLPSEPRPTECMSPPSIAVTPDIPLTFTAMVVPQAMLLPSTPPQFAPHPSTVPSHLAANEWSEPDPMPTTPVNRTTLTAVVRMFTPVPSPNWPYQL